MQSLVYIICVHKYVYVIFYRTYLNDLECSNMSNNTTQHSGGCPVTGAGASQAAGGGRQNRDWWPKMLNVGILRQHSDLSSPMDESFDYAEEFNSLDLAAVKKDLHALMTTSQDWWPADYGHYGPFFVRMAWHVSGTYRSGDGRGGAGQGLQRFAPTNSWPDNANLDKARRLLWPIKQKYGRKISWADLFMLCGNMAHESMGFKTWGFGGGREDIYEPAQDIYWGEEAEWLGNEARYGGTREDKGSAGLERPLAAVHMGLIYVNPEGPNGNPDPIESAKDIRETFGRMAMNDEETVALIAGGHTFGKAHGAAPDSQVGPEPNASEIHNQGFGWESSYKSGKGADAITSGLEGAWTPDPIKWDSGYFDMLFKYEWKLGKSPAGANQWYPVNQDAADTVPPVSDGAPNTDLVMFTSDLALIKDPEYRKVSEKFHKDHAAFSEAYARAWYKLTHRDMGPITRHLGPDVPKEALIWQDPLPKASADSLSKSEINELKEKILSSGLSVGELVNVAWASASTFRNSDKRGGANGARIRLAPQKDWAANDAPTLDKVLKVLNGIQASFSKDVSIADLIVLGGTCAIEEAAKKAGVSINVPTTLGRVDASEEHTDAEGYAVLEPETDGFRNFMKTVYTVPAESLLLDKAQLLSLSASEMTALVGGMRVLGANHQGSEHGVLTQSVGQLSNDFFVNLLDMSTKWEPVDSHNQVFEGIDRQSGKTKWSASRVDLIFGHNHELRALAEVYAADDAKEKFVHDFVSAWSKVMDLDRFDA